MHGKCFFNAEPGQSSCEGTLLITSKGTPQYMGQREAVQRRQHSEKDNWLTTVSQTQISSNWAPNLKKITQSQRNSIRWWQSQTGRGHPDYHSVSLHPKRYYHGQVTCPVWASFLFVWHGWVALNSEAPNSKTLCGLHFHRYGRSLSDSMSMTAVDKCPQFLYDGNSSIPILGPEEEQSETSLQGYVPEGRRQSYYQEWPNPDHFLGKPLVRFTAFLWDHFPLPHRLQSRTQKGAQLLLPQRQIGLK